MQSVSKLVQCLALGVFAADCAQSERHTTLVLEESRACAVVLVADVPESATEVRRYQILTRERGLDSPYMEHLGWEFIALARETRDDSWYLLAGKIAQCMLDQDGDDLSALLLQGHVLQSAHRFAEAEAIGRRLVRERGQWFDFGLHGDALLELGLVAEAADAYQNKLDQRPGTESYARAAQIRWLTGDTDGAIAAMRMSARSAGRPAGEAAAWANTTLASFLAAQGGAQEAAAILDAVLAQRPDFSPALVQRGRLALARSGYPAAINDLRLALETASVPEVRWALMEALDANGALAEADVHRAAMTRDGGRHDARDYALYLATTGQMPALALDLASAERSRRGDVHTLDALAWAQRAAGQTRLTQRNIAQALAVGTEDARIFFHAAAIAADADERAQAAALAARAAALNAPLLPAESRQLEELIVTLETKPGPIATAATIADVFNDHSRIEEGNQ